MSTVFEDHPVVSTALAVVFEALLLHSAFNVFGLELNLETRKAIYVATGSVLGLATTRSATKDLLWSVGHGSRSLVQFPSYKQIVMLSALFWFVLYSTVSFSVQLAGGDSIALLSANNGLLIALSGILGIAGNVKYDISSLFVQIGRFFFGILLAVGIIAALYFADSILFTTDSLSVTPDTMASLVGPIIVAAILASGIQFLLSALSGQTTEQVERNRLPKCIELDSSFSRKYKEAVSTLTREFVGFSEDSVRHSPTEKTVQIVSNDGEEVSITVNPRNLSSENKCTYSNLVSELASEERHWLLRDEVPDYPDDIETKQTLEVKVVEVPTAEGQTLRNKFRLQLQAIKRILSRND